MKQTVWTAGIIGSMAFIIGLLITSFQIVLYGIPGFYEKEYAKYNVLEDVKMEMTDVLYVTEEMMDYLVDKREDLVVVTRVDGEEREFFNDREKIHMEDVKELFMGGLLIRRAAFLIAAVCLGFMAAVKSDIRRILPRAFWIGTGIMGGLTAVLAILAAANFSAVFVQFHLLFFDNDFWILDPATDLMINILPEGFFFDTVKTIGLVFALLLTACLGVSVWLAKREKKNRNGQFQD